MIICIFVLSGVISVCLCFICLGPPSSLACASWFWSSCYIHNAKYLEGEKKIVFLKRTNSNISTGYAFIPLDILFQEVLVH